MSEQFGLKEAVSMALGGMIGGGIYAVLGVVAKIAMYATWFGFAVAGIVAVCAGYSYNKLNEIGETHGGSVSFVQEFVGHSTLAGMVGWSLLFGYIGSMAMYAFAFAEFVIGFSMIPSMVAGFSLRPIISITAVALFVLLNIAGARVTGSAENVLVAAKVGILVAFGIWGLIYLVPITRQPTNLGFANLTGLTPIVAASLSFVAFQGWQLLFYDQESIADPRSTIPKAVYISIPIAVLIYIMVAIVTTNLAPQAIQTHPHIALADAASAMLSYFGIAEMGFVIISLSALFSTGSAINATLFSSAHFAKGMISSDLLPDHFGSTDVDGPPDKTILILGIVTAGFTAWGSLEAITSFASLAFIVVFGSMSVLAFRNRDHEEINPILPAIGTIGTFIFAPVMFWNLYHREPTTFWMVLIIAVIVIGIELLYFERDELPDNVVGIEGNIREDLREIEQDLEELEEDIETIREDIRKLEVQSDEEES
ncbi:MAG: APC family permease [Halobacteriaceae archaeon]